MYQRTVLGQKGSRKGDRGSGNLFLHRKAPNERKRRDNKRKNQKKNRKAISEKKKIEREIRA